MRGGESKGSLTFTDDTDQAAGWKVHEKHNNNMQNAIKLKILIWRSSLRPEMKGMKRANL